MQGHNRVDVENLKLIVTILVIAAAPICAQAQKLTPRFMETSIFVTELAQQFSLSLVGPSHPVVVPLPGWPEQASADFLILGLSCLLIFSKFTRTSVDIVASIPGNGFYSNMQTKDVQPLLKLFFGPSAGLCWDQMAPIKAATANVTYTFMNKAEHDALVQHHPLEAIAVYWNEMIQRIHLGSCSALLRHEQWLNGMAIAAEHECYFGFFSSFRGFLESAADSAYSLGNAAYFLADNLTQIIATCKSGPRISFLDHTNWRNA